MPRIPPPELLSGLSMPTPARRSAGTTATPPESRSFTPEDIANLQMHNAPALGGFRNAAPERQVTPGTRPDPVSIANRLTGADAAAHLAAVNEDVNLPLPDLIPAQADRAVAGCTRDDAAPHEAAKSQARRAVLHEGMRCIDAAARFGLADDRVEVGLLMLIAAKEIGVRRIQEGASLRGVMRELGIPSPPPQGPLRHVDNAVLAYDVLVDALYQHATAADRQPPPL